jgi:GT2 family glycosyltransferase
MATKVLTVEITEPLPSISDIDRYSAVRVLVKSYGMPLGYVVMSGYQHEIAPEQLAIEISNRYAPEIARQMVCHDLLKKPARSRTKRYASKRSRNGPTHLPLLFISVLVCTRDRTGSLKHTLDSLMKLDYPRHEVLVIDNAPSTAETEELVKNYPFRYVLEPRPGLDWARNRGIAESKGDIVAYIDDDAVADPGWLWGIRAGFVDPGTMCVTGLLLPSELETTAQEIFEIHYGGFSRGFERTVYRRGELWKYQTCWPSVGTGCNMAFRREVFDRVGVFDVAFDVGTPTCGSGDLDMFHRLMRAGCTIEYRPEALQYHTHRRSVEALLNQFRCYGKSFVAFQTKCFLKEPDSRWLITKYMLRWYGAYHLGRIVRRLLGREGVPMRMILAEVRSSLGGPLAYLKSLRHAKKVSRDFSGDGYSTKIGSGMALLVRRIELAEGVDDIHLPSDYCGVMALVTDHGAPLGDITIRTHLRAISAQTLRDTISDQFHDKILSLLLQRKMNPSGKHSIDETLHSVAVVVPTNNRSDHLCRCLQSIANTKYARKTVIVVDNGLDSEWTYHLVQEYGATYVREGKRGANFARNAGIRASDADIVVFTDDDCVVDEMWLDHIVNAFKSDTSIAAVAGLAMPYEIESEAQELFEVYGDGGMRKGYDRRVYDRFNFPPVQAGRIGVGGNMAFRTSVLREVGGLDEALCPGTPAKCGEEPDIFYRLLIRGYKICYEPRALIWHSHRRSMDELKHQLACYSIGTYAVLTKFLVEYHELGALRIGCGWFLHHHIRDLIQGLRGRGVMPLRLTLAEISGVFRGPIAYFQSKSYVSEVRLQERSERRGRPIGKKRTKSGTMMARRAGVILGRLRPGRRSVRDA